jgi:putative phage-type endonuclease
MSPIMEGVSQNTPEWIVARIGCATASRVKDVMDFGAKGKESAKRRNYRMEVVQELLTGRAADHFVTPAMEFGLENEDLAVEAYGMKIGVELEPGGFWVHDRISRFAASPDRLLGDDGLLEVKVPTVATHLEYIIAGVIPEDYVPQMLAQMSCTGRKYCDFVSYRPDLPKFLQLFVRRLPRDEEKVAEVESAVEKFLGEVAETIELLGQAREQEFKPVAVGTEEDV